VCGIAGQFAVEQVDPERFYRAHSVLGHRGPDDEGLVAGGAPGTPATQFSGDSTRGRWKKLPDVRGAGLVRWILSQHRLKIIDLSEDGHGPMSTQDGRLWLTYNGEVYNYRELRNELSALGHRFVSQTDTEVVLHSFAEWGLDCFSRFNGMWALAIYDVETGSLVLSRDRFGVKPLFYGHDGDGLMFASEPKFFRELRPLRVNPRAAAEFLVDTRTDHRSETFHEGVLQLPPAHHAVYDARSNELAVTPYWTLPSQDARDVPMDEAVNAFAELFDSAVDLRMRSDVPVGGLLSGGLDSSAVVRNLDHRGKLGSHGIQTFSAVYDEEAYSERRYIEQVVADSEHVAPTYVCIGAEEAREGLGDVIRAQDAPFRSVSVYCQHRLYETVRAESPVVVLLNGQGADECFGGYTAHYYGLLASHAMHGRLGRLARDARWLVQNRDARPRSVVEIAAYRLWRTVRGRRTRERVVKHPALSREFPVTEPVYSRDPFDDQLRSNLLFSALPEYLRYEDRNSMASSLETRLPFLDYRLVEWAFTLPADLKLTRGETKRVVRQATAPYVPRLVSGRTDKMGFTSPQETWQAGVLEPWVRDGIERIELDFLDRDALMADYAGGRRSDPFFWFRAACLGWWQELACS
jgi:asparagine synthase (glutamine-hydrolysing)